MQLKPTSVFECFSQKCEKGTQLRRNSSQQNTSSVFRTNFGRKMNTFKKVRVHLSLLNSFFLFPQKYTRILLKSRNKAYTQPQHHDNIICLIGQSGDVLHPLRACSERGGTMYVTWSELIAFVAMITGIVAVVVEIHKKQPSCPGKADDYFLEIIFRRSG